MEKKGKSTPVKKTATKTKVASSPYADYNISNFLRGQRFRYKGSDLDANNLSLKQLEVLAADENFKHITKKEVKK